MALKNFLNKYSLDILGNIETTNDNKLKEALKEPVKYPKIRDFQTDYSLQSSQTSSPPIITSPTFSPKSPRSWDSEVVVLSLESSKSNVAQIQPEQKVKNSPRRKELLKESEGEPVNSFISPRKRSHPKILNEQDEELKRKLKDIMRKSREEKYQD